MGRKKKTEDFDEFDEDMDLESEEEEEEEDFTPKQKEQVGVAQEALKNIHDVITKQNKAIKVNQDYIKRLWERVRILEDNFRLLYEEQGKK